MRTKEEIEKEIFALEEKKLYHEMADRMTRADWDGLEFCNRELHKLYIELKELKNVQN